MRSPTGDDGEVAVDDGCVLDQLKKRMGEDEVEGDGGCGMEDDGHGRDGRWRWEEKMESMEQSLKILLIKAE